MQAGTGQANFESHPFLAKRTHPAKCAGDQRMTQRPTDLKKQTQIVRPARRKQFLYETNCGILGTPTGAGT